MKDETAQAMEQVLEKLKKLEADNAELRESLNKARQRISQLNGDNCEHVIQDGICTFCGFEPKKSGAW